MSYIGFPSNPPPTFPALPVVGFAVHKKPFFSAWEHKSVLGSQYQTARQVYPNWDFVLQYGDESWLREQTQNIVKYVHNSPYVEFETISQLFLSCYGSYGEFWYDDPTDDSRFVQNIGVGDNATTVFRVVRTWGDRPVSGAALQGTEPVGGVNLLNPVVVYLNGTIQDPGTYIVTNSLNGSYLTFTSPPAGGAAIQMDFSFFYRCRFKDPIQQYDQWNYNLWQLGKCEFRSVKP